MPTNVLVVGSGGREHAIAWKVLQSKNVEKVYVAPGNGGTAALNVPIKADDIRGLYEFAKEKQCLTIVGPEGPLAAGIVDHFTKYGLPIIGPTAKEAMLETSKAYAKSFMVSNCIPTAEFGTFEESEAAIDYAYRLNGRVAVKADGLAAGKGVFVCSSAREAEQAIGLILRDNAFGAAGKKIVVEERLEGKECSIMTLCNGKTAIPFGSARDHKRVFDQDRGPNTGGMGAFSPADGLSSAALNEIVKNIAERAVRASNFHGFLYLGLMLTAEGPKVLEFNARLGDPETQVILPRLRTDYLSALQMINEPDLKIELEWSDSSCCTVVMCSEGYPQNPRIGDQVSGLEQAAKSDRVIIFHSGTRRQGEDYFTTGGRVLSVTGLGDTLQSAAERAYSAVSLISWPGEHHRNDIGRIT